MKNVGLQFYSKEKDCSWISIQKKDRTCFNEFNFECSEIYSRIWKGPVIVEKINRNNQPRLQILVKDNGIGIAKEQLPYI